MENFPLESINCEKVKKASALTHAIYPNIEYILLRNFTWSRETTAMCIGTVGHQKYALPRRQEIEKTQ